MRKSITWPVRAAESDSLDAQDQAPGARARLALVRAAVQVFGENSLGTASTRDIARRAEQNVAAISYYFGGKQGLYLAVMQYVAHVIEQRAAPMLEPATRFIEAGRFPPAQCLYHLSKLLENSVSNSKDAELVALSGIIVREQTNVTAAFDVLYNGVLGRLHQTGERLIAAYVTGSPHTPGFSVHYHALLSQALGFRLARATAMRSAGWEDIGEAEESVIRAVVLEHAELVLKGLRAKHLRSLKASNVSQAPSI